MVIPERIRDRLAAAGLSQSELARRIKVSQGTIAKLATGGATGSSHLHKIAAALGTTAGYLTGETDDPTAGALPMPTPEIVAEQLDLVPISEASLEYGLGAAFLQEHVEEVPRYFPRQWLELWTSSPATSLFFARGKGDSMMPTLLDGDIILIDRSQQRISEQDLIWAVAYGEMGAIKRVRRGARGEFRIMSDNPAVRDEVLDADDLTIVGRVVWIGRKM